MTSVVHARELAISGSPPPKGLERIIGSSWFVYLEGEIDANAAKRLEAYIQENDVPPTSLVILNSPGGSLVGGLELGKVIRKHNLSTDIGVQKVSAQGARSYEPGICFSACATAYLGGRFRFLTQGSRYGVHRFYFSTSTGRDTDMAQMLSAVVVSYLKEMEIDSELFTLTTAAGKDEMFEPPLAKLKELRVVNNGFTEPKWTLEGRANLIYLKGERDTIHGINKFLLFCGKNNGILLHVIFDPQGRQDEVMRLPAHSLVINGNDVPISAANKVIQNDWFNATYFLSAEQVLAIRGAESIGLVVRPSYEAPIFLGFNNMRFKDGVEKFSGLLNGCGYATNPSPVSGAARSRTIQRSN